MPKKTKKRAANSRLSVKPSAAQKRALMAAKKKQQLAAKKLQSAIKEKQQIKNSAIKEQRKIKISLKNQMRKEMKKLRETFLKKIKQEKLKAFKQGCIVTMQKQEKELRKFDEQRNKKLFKLPKATTRKKAKSRRKAA